MENENIVMLPGICPVCGSDNIFYEAIEPYGEGVYYPATCDDCGTTFKECYTLSFDTHVDIETNLNETTGGIVE